jgi:triosephosphate isomerase
MTKKQVLLVGNWKMNLSPSQAADFARAMREGLPDLAYTSVWVAPPAISAAHVINELVGTPIEVGAQNVHWEPCGAFTGETAAIFAKDLGLTFSLVGHSERRSLFGETSEQVALRMRGAIQVGLTPVVCIGETENERVAGRTEQVLASQLEPLYHHLTHETAQRVILAYEPVWAIGTGKVASESEIQETHAYIQKEWLSRGYSSAPTILYGGSVSPKNFSGIIALPAVSGALVGGASLKLDQWFELVKTASMAKSRQ